MRKIIFLMLTIFSINSFAFSLFPSNNSAMDCTAYISIKKCDLRLDSEIKETDTYINLAQEIDELKTGDVVRVHLAGYGGSGHGLVYLLNHIKASKGKFIAVVEGPVYSAHAILAVSLDDIEVLGTSFMMFHNISSAGMTDTICEAKQGRDRGVAEYTKCMEDTPKYNEYFNKYIDKFVSKVLTPEELQLHDSGHNVILDSALVKQRFDNNKK